MTNAKTNDTKEYMMHNKKRSIPIECYEKWFCGRMDSIYCVRAHEGECRTVEARWKMEKYHQTHHVLSYFRFCFYLFFL